MFGLNISTIAKICGGRFYGSSEILDTEPCGIVTDSRKVEKGCIYAAIEGAKNDGHDYIKGAIASGAVCAIAEHEPYTKAYEESDSVNGAEHEVPQNTRDFSDCPYILVADTGEALRSIAEYFRIHTDISVVGITGSVGKTSTKETIAAVLAKKFRVHKTAGNFNNQLGVPLTMFGLKKDDEILVMEMGISHFGDMDVVARIGRPNISVITNIADCHLENLIDRDGVLKEKTEIFKWMTGDGPAILNGDDEKLRLVSSANGRTPIMCHTIDDSVSIISGKSDVNSVGCNEPGNKLLQTTSGSKNIGNSSELLISDNCMPGDFYAGNIESLGLRGMRCRVYGPGLWQDGIDIMIPVPGRHMVNNALMACAVSNEFGMTPEEVREGLLTLTSLAGRGEIISTARYDIMNDCYNANPASMWASLKTLAMATGRKVAILGDMFELGSNEAELHRRVGAEAAGLGTDLLICVGKLSENIAIGAGYVFNAEETERTTVKYFSNVEEFLNHRNELLLKGDTILVKASHGMHLEKIVEILKNDK